MTKPWFRARSFGWGWTAISVEGWAVTIWFLVLSMIAIGIFMHEVQAGADAMLANLLLLGSLAALAGLLIGICWLTGERPRWRWGK